MAHLQYEGERRINAALPPPPDIYRSDVTRVSQHNIAEVR
jgi:hypothetical protein